MISKRLHHINDTEGKKSLQSDKVFILLPSVLDTAVSVPSTWSNCWPDPSPLLHTTNLGPRPETTVVSSTLRQRSNNWIITIQDSIIQHCPW